MPEDVSPGRHQENDVPGLIIRREEAADGPVKSGSTVGLAAELSPGGALGAGVDPAWQLDGRALDGVGWKRSFMMTGDAVGTYTATVTMDGELVRSNSLVLELEGTKVSNDDAGAPVQRRETPAIFHPVFAVLSALVAIGLGYLVLEPVIRGIRSFTWGSITGEQAPEVLGGVVALSLVALGGVALLSGTWLALVEGRGRLVKKVPPSRGVVVDDKLVDAIGRLRGAALLLVVGALVLLASAWIGQSAVGNGGMPTTPSSGSTSSGTPAVTATPSSAHVPPQPDVAPTP